MQRRNAGCNGRLSQFIAANGANGFAEQTELRRLEGTRRTCLRASSANPSSHGRVRSSEQSRRSAGVLGSLVAFVTDAVTRLFRRVAKQSPCEKPATFAVCAQWTQVGAKGRCPHGTDKKSAPCRISREHRVYTVVRCPAGALSSPMLGASERSAFAFLKGTGTWFMHGCDRRIGDVLGGGRSRRRSSRAR